VPPFAQVREAVHQRLAGQVAEPGVEKERLHQMCLSAGGLVEPEAVVRQAAMHVGLRRQVRGPPGGVPGSGAVVRAAVLRRTHRASTRESQPRAGEDAPGPVDFPVGPDNMWRLDVSDGGAGTRKSNEDGVEVTRGGWSRMQGPRIRATWGTGLRKALEDLPRRQYTGGARGNFYAWEVEQQRRVLASPSSGTSGLSAGQIYLIVGLVVFVMVIGTCGLCVGAELK